jgi:cytochrome b subunit of formate dehydrogenase
MADSREVKTPVLMKQVIYYRDAVEAVKRLRTASDGSRYVVRFSLGRRIEHFILILSVTTLAVTGLAQSYYDTLAGEFILALFGGIEASRLVHRFAAFVFGAQSLYHIAMFIDNAFVHRRPGKMFFTWKDVKDFFQMIKFNLGVAAHRPRFDRYSFESKVEYWAFAVSMILLGVTGIVQWFPAQVTEFLPVGWIIPVGRSIHRFQAILVVLSLLTWHFYHHVIKKLNLSIFNGKMTIDEMKEEHPLELTYLEHASAAIQNKLWPIVIEIPFEASVDFNVPDRLEESALEKNNEGNIQ